MDILFYILIAFIGYAIGRISHIYWGYLAVPHHWIYALVLIIIGLFFYNYFLGLIAFYFGLGYFVSDFKDFLQLKFFGADEPGQKRFWGID